MLHRAIGKVPPAMGPCRLDAGGDGTDHPASAYKNRLAVSPFTLRRWSYRLSALLAALYVGYVLVQKVLNRTMGGPLGDVGEFLLVLACVTAFAVGLFADEALRRAETPSNDPPHRSETP